MSAPTVTRPLDARGAELYEDDEVIDLAKNDRVRILRIHGEKVLLSSGVTTRANRVEYVR